MRRLLRSALLFVFAALASPAMAQVPFGQASTVKEGLEIGASTSEIAIASDFRGADLTIFGALTNADELFLAIGQYDLIVTLEGPKDYATVRKKERVFGIWMNTQSMTFEQVPESYSMASTRQIDSIDQPTSLNDIGVGIDHLALNPVGYIPDSGLIGEFRDAYRRLKLTSGLYQRDTSGVRFVSSSLFRASLRLPANIPDGVHVVRAYLFKSGQLILQKELPLRVVKTGIEQAITDAAHNRPLAYGFLCVLIAVITGWGASLIFRKD
ncbi:TIGR02186 family protein [Neorhizobium sp. CSC1952]|uniref:TIGR02186 family protein n=1 Tax=Neorhizobium sp. CSC1952 TaxID=2978974 RepID=UPI0025A557F2|nr:TIGR02186 family protein [Rhizobium sp. CSC1952]WJR68190.1 TIGR02186 family protein [Rhizobium sp. CSC1952]